MAARSQFGQELDQNVRRGPNINIETRARAIGMLQGGCTVKEVAEAINRSVRAVRELRKKYHQTGTIQDKPRSGRPPVLSLNQKKIIYRAARKALKIEYSELAKVAIFVDSDSTPLKPPSRSTLYRYLKARGLGNFPCKVRPKLNRAHALKRLQFCRQYRHF
jgi:hypothetical protein